MEVKDIMSKDIVIADLNDTIMDVAKLMAHHNIGCVPVTEDGYKVLGVITDRDIILSLAKYELDPAITSVSNIMTNKVYSVKPDADLKDALDLMKKERIRRLPVIENNTLLGIVSLGDFAVHGNSFKEEISQALSEISTPARPRNI